MIGQYNYYQMKVIKTNNKSVQKVMLPSLKRPTYSEKKAARDFQQNLSFPEFHPSLPHQNRPSLLLNKDKIKFKIDKDIVNSLEIDNQTINFQQNIRLNRILIKKQIAKRKIKNKKSQQYQKANLVIAKSRSFKTEPKCFSEDLFSQISKIMHRQTDKQLQTINYSINDQKMDKGNKINQIKERRSSQKLELIKDLGNRHQWKKLHFDKANGAYYRQSSFECENKRLTEFIAKNQFSLLDYLQNQKYLISLNIGAGKANKRKYKQENQ